MEKRDYRIDLLRSIALGCIILAHVGPSSFVFELRNFDVTCMCFLMGMSYCLTAKDLDFFGYIHYIIKRFRRLVIPTWIFLTIYFIVFNFLGISFTLHDYKYSYFMIDGIGYVWIMRVYMLIAILMPFFMFICKNVNSEGILLFILIICYGSYLYLIDVYNSGIVSGHHINILFMYFVLYGIGFGLISYIGLIYTQISSKMKVVIFLLLGACFLLIVNNNGFMSLQAYKYPPTAYYITYGICVSIILYELFGLKIFEKFINLKIWTWISKNSLWLYFLHVFPVTAIKIYNLGCIENTTVFRWLFCVVIAIIMTLMMNNLIKYGKIGKKKAYERFHKENVEKIR
ncbi:MAG: acyltransferase [Lachnospiraceae bacterium]